MGVGPQPIRHAALHRDQFFHLVGDTCSMMREERNADQQKTHNENRVHRGSERHDAYLRSSYLLIPLPAGFRTPSLKLSSSEGTQYASSRTVWPFGNCRWNICLPPTQGF